jgi:hypothetical protein
VEGLLLGGGIGGLAWWRIRESPLGQTAAAERCHAVFRQQFFTNIRQQTRIAAAFACLSAAGIDALMGKGWSAARLYPHPGLRPCGDIDLYVRTADYPCAARALEDSGVILVDLHRGFAELDDRDEASLFVRSRHVPVVGGTARVFGDEDHARLLCLHALRHGLVRPLWLCDIAATSELIDDGFDWDRLLSGGSERSRWTLAALELARVLLECRDVIPKRLGMGALPRWVIPAVLSEWSCGRPPHGARVPMSRLRGDPRMFAKELWRRWPNAIEATVGMGGRFNAWPRLPYQLAECARRSAIFVRTVAG